MFNPYKEICEYTPEVLTYYASALQDLRLALQDLRRQLLFSDETGADPVSLAHFFLALSAMEQAKQQFKLAQYAQSRALTTEGH
jgi:hypothetical protein